MGDGRGGARRGNGEFYLAASMATHRQGNQSAGSALVGTRDGVPRLLSGAVTVNFSSEVAAERSRELDELYKKDMGCFGLRRTDAD